MTILEGRRSILVLAAVVGLAFLGALALSSWQDGDSPAPSPGLLASSDPGPIHVHGLGVNPKDGALLIATHTGLFRVPRGETKAARVADRRQDTMGFTIVGPDRFLGSGHPDLNEARANGLPPLLGLIESSDAGGSWRSISLLGEADFHVLRSRGDRVYGYDATNARLMISRDGGRRWSERQPPAPLVDLAVDPAKPDAMLATADDGLYASGDEGRRWQRLSARIGLLAWPSPARLYLLESSGLVLISRDEGRSWEPTSEIGGQPAAFLAQTERELYAALHDGTIKRSTDGGRSWAIRSTP